MTFGLWFVSACTTAVLRVDLQGNARVLCHPGAEETTVGIPSPDGRHLAILGWSETGNIWMMENF